MKLAARLLFVIFGLNLVGCASGMKDYNTFVLPNSSIASSTQELLKLKPANSLRFNKEQIWDITFNDPIMELNNIKSNYRAFSFEGNISKQFTIEIWSRCDCLGFNKTIMHPMAFIIDGDGEVVNQSNIKFASGRMGWSRPANVYGKWTGKVEKDETYYLIIAADNRSLGKSVGSVDATNYAAPHAPIRISLSHYPAGEVETKITSQ